MKILNLNTKKLVPLGLLFAFTFSFAQQGHLEIHQDEALPRLLALKKVMNSSENHAGKYRIQIFSGDRVTAEAEKSTFDRALFGWNSTLVYETPNYKVWVGSYRTRLGADRALEKIKKEFPGAFIFKPKIKDK